MKLSEYEDRTPEELWRLALKELSPMTRKYYENYFIESLKFFETDIDSFYEWVVKIQNSDKASDRLALNNAFSDLTEHLTTERIPPIGKNTLSHFKKAINKFLEANALQKMTKKVKKIESNGVAILTKKLVKEVVDYQVINLRNRALAMTAKDTGLRCSDLSQLTVEDFLQAEKLFNRNGQEFRVWRNPIITQKTQVRAHPIMGPESVEAVKNYIAGRNSSAIFLTIQSQHGGKRGRPMTQYNISKVFRNICLPLKKRGIKASAHSFRKFFLSNLQHVEKMSKMVSGKKLPPSDIPYYLLDPKLYIDNYSHISIDETDIIQNKVETLEKEKNKLEKTVDKLVKMYVNLEGQVNQMNQLSQLNRDPPTHSSEEEALESQKTGPRRTKAEIQKLRAELDKELAKIQEADL